MVRRVATLPHILQYPSEMVSLSPKQIYRILGYPNCWWLLAMMFLSPVCAHAEPQPAIDAAPLLTPAKLLPAAASAVEGISAPVVEEPPSSNFVDPFINTPRDYVSKTFVALVSRIDTFFGNNSNFQESNNSVIQYDIMRIYDRNGVNNVAPSFRAKIHLPGVQDRFYQWQKRLHLMLESNPDKNPSLPGEKNQQSRTSLFRELATPDSYGAALRLETDENSPWRFSADTGLKLENNELIRPFLRSRASYTTQAGMVQLKVAESVYWFDTTGLGESTQFDADRRLSESVLLRATSAATWLKNTLNFDLRQDLSLYHTFNDSTSFLYQLSAVGASRPEPELSEYVALLLCRQRIHRDWVFLELSPQLHYPKTSDYQLDAQFIMRLEVLFSK